MKFTTTLIAAVAGSANALKCYTFNEDSGDCSAITTQATVKPVSATCQDAPDGLTNYCVGASGAGSGCNMMGGGCVPLKSCDDWDKLVKADVPKGISLGDTVCCTTDNCNSVDSLSPSTGAT